MAHASRSCRLTDLTWVQVEDHLTRESRLIVPVGVCDQFGPHLPLGAGTLIAEAVAADLARDFAILQAPTIAYGVNLPTARPYPGTASLHEKSLHRVLNDLLASWEDDGFTEFILITAHRYESHVDALASATGTRARVRAVEVLGIDFSQFLTGAGGREHGGEAVTSLMLHLYPEKVNLTLAQDYRPGTGAGSAMKRLSRLPTESPGSVGEATLGTAEKGRLIYEYILQKVRSRVFITDEEPSAE